MEKSLLLATSRGYCFGVKKALELVEKTLSQSHQNPIIVFNEIVHNRIVVDQLKARGVMFTSELESIPKKSAVIISAHGVGPHVYKCLKEKDCEIIDATCPLVKKVHDKVHHYSELGYHILYIGKASHEEAIGVMAENPTNITLIESEADLNKIPLSRPRYIVLNQTTLNMFDVESLYEKIRATLPNIEMPKKNDLCYTTTERQQAVKSIAAQCEAVIVIGSANSSNSRKLCEVAQAQGAKAILVDTVDEIQDSWLDGISHIGVTSGASAPEFLVEGVINRLVKRGFSVTNVK